MTEKEKDPLAAALGRRGGLKGGPARAASLSPIQRAYASRYAAEVRWTKRRYQEMTTALAPTKPTKLVKVARTHVLVITDMSGSMAGLAADTRGGFNHYLEELRKDRGNYLVSATLFNTQIYPLFTELRPELAAELDERNYQPGDFTALLDAVGSTLEEFGELPADDNAICLIQTDGMENASRRYREDQVKAMIAERTESGRWLFLYLGAGPDVWDHAAGLGIAAAQTFSTPQTAHGTAARYAGMSAATASWHATSSPVAASSSYLGTPGAIDPLHRPPPTSTPRRSTSPLTQPPPGIPSSQRPGRFGKGSQRSGSSSSRFGKGQG